MELSGNDLRFLKRRARPRYEDGPRPVRVVDLFSGCGGLSLGVAEACLAAGRAFELRLAMESSAVVQAVFDANFTPAVRSRRGDVLSRFDKTVGSRLSLQERTTAKECGTVDFLLGGPPCQGHSNLNNYSRRVDPKNELYMTMVRAAEVLRPSHAIIENVHGVQRDRSCVLERAIDALHGLGYAIDHRVIRLADIGVPQRRVRHILFASRVMKPNQVAALETALVSAPRTLRWAIGDLLRTPSKRMLDTAALMTPENQKRAQYLLRRGLYDLPNHMRPPCHRNNPGHRYLSMYGRLNWDEPAQTITTGFGSPGQGRYLHPSRPRTLTPHEAARLQFFPDWYDFSSAPYRSVLDHCIGNAVPPKLTFLLALHTLGAVESQSGRPSSRQTQRLAMI